MQIKYKELLSNPAVAWTLTTIACLLLYYSTTALAVDKTDTASVLGYVMGKNFGYALVGGALLKFTLFRSVQPKNFFISFATVFLVLALLYTVVGYHEKQGEKEFASDLINIIEGADNPAGQLSSAPTSARSDSTEIDRFKTLIKESLVARSASGNAYTAATNKVGDILTPESLADRNMSQESLKKLDVLETALQTYVGGMEKIYQQLRANIQALDLSPEFKTEFLSGMEKGYAANTPLAEAFEQNQKAIIQKMSDIISFTAKVDVTLSKEKELVFAQQTDADTYNKLIEEFQALAADEEKITKQLMESLEDRKKKLKARAQ